MKKTFLLAFLLPLALMGCQDKAKQQEQERELEELRQLAEMDRREMENQYEQFTLQYDELKKGIKDDSLLVKLEAEQQRTEKLLAELRAVKKNDAAEIRRLKSELESVRAVLRSYIMQVDSLTRENGRLTNERDEARHLLTDANSRISNLDNERAALSDKVAIASQLNASAISLQPVKKNSKPAKRTKDIVRFVVNFTIDRNVTATTGERAVYIRLMSPNASVLGAAGQFEYQGKQLDYSAMKRVEYTGEATRESVVVGVSNDFLAPGKYSAHIFCDGQLIGAASVNIES